MQNFSRIRKFFDIVSEMEDVISLGVGEPDFDTPWHIRDEGIYTLEKGRTFYTSNSGLKELRVAIAEYLRRRFEVSYDPLHEILVTVGGSEGIDVALRAMLDPGDEVLIPEPCYVSYVPCVVLADGVPVTIELKEENQFRLTKEELLAAITDKTKILVMPFPNNPTGGMRQRVGIAMGMTYQPKLLLADEPTSALDVTIQAQIVRQMMQLRDEYNTGIIVVTHNLGVAAYMSDYIIVMKHGKIEDQGTREYILKESKNEYTRKLLDAVPSLGGEFYV